MQLKFVMAEPCLSFKAEHDGIYLINYDNKERSVLYLEAEELFEPENTIISTELLASCSRERFLKGTTDGMEALIEVLRKIKDD